MTKPVHALGLLIMLKMTAATNPSSAPVQCADRNLRCGEWFAHGLCTDADYNMRLYVNEACPVTCNNCGPGWQPFDTTIPATTEAADTTVTDAPAPAPAVTTIAATATTAAAAATTAAAGEDRVGGGSHTNHGMNGMAGKGKGSKHVNGFGSGEGGKGSSKGKRSNHPKTGKLSVPGSVSGDNSAATATSDSKSSALWLCGFGIGLIAVGIAARSFSSGRQQKEGSELEYSDATEREPNEIEIIVPQVSPMRPKQQQHGAETPQSYGSVDIDPR